ncbi:MAG: hypothetical protein HYY76_16300 [Acidobacteria bacterium]|nr:hypothetical protein [Acidobacteriota bacterium]
MDLLQHALVRYRRRYGAIVDEAVMKMRGTAPATADGPSPSISYAVMSNRLPAGDAESEDLERCASAEDHPVLHLTESTAGRIHVHNFGARYGGRHGERTFSVVVSLRSGVRLGPVRGVRVGDLFTRMDYERKHYRGSTYFKRDVFIVEGERLRGGTAVTENLARRLNRGE